MWEHRAVSPHGGFLRWTMHRSDYNEPLLPVTSWYDVITLYVPGYEQKLWSHVLGCMLYWEHVGTEAQGSSIHQMSKRGPIPRLVTHRSHTEVGSLRSHSFYYKISDNSKQSLHSLVWVFMASADGTIQQCQPQNPQRAWFQIPLIEVQNNLSREMALIIFISSLTFQLSFLPSYSLSWNFISSNWGRGEAIIRSLTGICSFI